MADMAQTHTRQCVIGLAFGYRADASGKRLPGQSNRTLASYIARKYAHLPLIMQHEITDALLELGIESEVSVTNEDTAYLDSRQVLQKAKIYMEQHGYDSAIVVAQAHHIPRIKLLCKKLGIPAVFPDDLPATWDAESEQQWTRSYLQWMVREPLVLAHHKIHRWI